MNSPFPKTLYPLYIPSQKVYSRILQAIKNENKSLIGRFKKIKKHIITNSVVFVLSLGIVTILLHIENENIGQKLENFENIEKTAKQLVLQIDKEQSNLLEKWSEQIENLTS